MSHTDLIDDLLRGRGGPDSDTRYTEAEMQHEVLRAKRRTEKLLEQEERTTVWSTGYMQRQLAKLQRERDEAAETADDVAGVARWKVLHDIVSRLEREQHEAVKARLQVGVTDHESIG